MRRCEDACNGESSVISIKFGGSELTSSREQGDGKFPVIIGEWSLQSQFNNTLAQRKTLYDTMLYVYSTYASGGSFWNYKMINDVDPVKGKKKLKGALEDYWNWEKLADAGIPSVKGVSNSYC